MLLEMEATSSFSDAEELVITEEEEPVLVMLADMLALGGRNDDDMLGRSPVDWSYGELRRGR